jgi:predicted Holliday junction resolvase-like endonuclease
MNYVILGVTSLIVLLVIALVIAIKVSQARCRKVKELEGDLESARQEMRRQGEYGKKKEEAQKNADDQKETLHTGDNTVDFGNSIEMLHGASKNRDC